jgi:hypothetical protein
MQNFLRITMLAACALLIAGAAFAADAPAKGGVQKFGAKIKVKKVTDIAALAKDPALFAGKKVRIEGAVKDVCQGRGCWCEVESNGASIIARSLDESVLLPKDCKGWSIVVQGVLKPLPPKAKAEAEVQAAAGAPGPALRAGAPGGSGHACPAPQWVLATQGVELTPPAAE